MNNIGKVEIKKPERMRLRVVQYFPLKDALT